MLIVTALFFLHVQCLRLFIESNFLKGRTIFLNIFIFFNLLDVKAYRLNISDTSDQFSYVCYCYFNFNDFDKLAIIEYTRNSVVLNNYTYDMLNKTLTVESFFNMYLFFNLVGISTLFNYSSFNKIKTINFTSKNNISILDNSLNIIKFNTNLFISQNFSFLFFFLRKSKMFNKGRYSRNRQTYRTGFYWCLYVNIMALVGLNFLFYKFTLNFSSLWFFFFLFIFSFFFTKIFKYNFFSNSTIYELLALKNYLFLL